MIEALATLPRSGVASLLATGNWQVALEHDVRNALLTTENKEIVWTIRQPGPLRLRFSYG